MFVGADSRRTGQNESDDGDIHRLCALTQVFEPGKTQITQIESDQSCRNQRGDSRQQGENAVCALLVESDGGSDEGGGQTGAIMGERKQRCADVQTYGTDERLVQGRG